MKQKNRKKRVPVIIKQEKSSIDSNTTTANNDNKSRQIPLADNQYSRLLNDEELNLREENLGVSNITKKKMRRNLTYKRIKIK